MKCGPKPKYKEPFNQTPGIPQPPKHLDKVARKHWQEITALLGKSNTLSLVDSDALELYCTLYARWRWAEDMMKQEGAVVMTPNGYPQQSPYLNIANACIKDMKSFQDAFGLTPKSREKLTMKEPTLAESKWVGLIG